VLVGEPRLAGGSLVGQAGEPAGLASTVLVGGSDWMVDLALNLTAPSAEVVVSCVAGGEASLMMRLAENRILVRHQGAERSSSTTVAGSRRLRIVSRAGELRIILDGRDVARFDHAAVPAQSTLRIEIAGSAWRLDEMQVVGGR
jgi:hypothetical protein